MRPKTEVPSTSPSQTIKVLSSRTQAEPSWLDTPKAKATLIMERGHRIATHSAEPDAEEFEQMRNMTFDPLMAIEIKNWLPRALDVDITLPDITWAAPIRGLAEVIVERLKAKAKVSQEPL